MDYKSFITAVEKRLNEMSEKQKNEWIYEQARTTASDQRQVFLNKLLHIKNTRYELSVKEIHQWCDQIDSGELYFTKETNEYDNDYDWESDWEIEYCDENNIIPFFEAAIHSTYQMLMNKDYKNAETITKRLLSLEFTYIEDDGSDDYDNDCDDYSDDYVDDCEKDSGTLSVEELRKEGLLETDLHQPALIQLYACYQINKGQTRMNKLYECLCQKECNGLTLTDVFTFGPVKIKDEELFIKPWCDFLKQQCTQKAAALLIDACIYIGGFDYLRQCAKECVDIHPALYSAYCKYSYQQGNDSKCIEAAKTALSLIEADKAIRADICDIAIQAAKRSEKHIEIKPFYIEAFCANPSVENLLHLLTLHDDDSNRRALKAVKHLSVSRFENHRSQNRKATFHSDEGKALCCFMLGDYREMIRLCQKENNSLGWSTNIKGIIIPLLLISMKQSTVQTAAETLLIKQLIARITYKDIYEEFVSVFYVWKQSFCLNDTEKADAIQWLHQEIVERSLAILAGSYRKSYWKAAALLIVLGIIEEEQGIPQAKAQLNETLKAQHNRKSAFWSEMRELAI